MKQVFSNFNLKKSASVLAAAAMLTLGSANLQAAPIEKIISPTEKQVSVNFVGSADNSLVFHLEFENKTGEKFYLIIKNDAGEVVYQNAYNDVHFAKNIRIPNENSDIQPTFIIRTSNESVERKLSVNSTMTEIYVVTAL